VFPPCSRLRSSPAAVLGPVLFPRAIGSVVWRNRVVERHVRRQLSTRSATEISGAARLIRWTCLRCHTAQLLSRRGRMPRSPMENGFYRSPDREPSGRIPSPPLGAGEERSADKRPARDSQGAEFITPIPNRCRRHLARQCQLYGAARKIGKGHSCRFNRYFSPSAIC
jgi:hypothetical protein